jgi:hypothetical protein
MQPITLLAIYLMPPPSWTAMQLDWKTLAFFPLLCSTDGWDCAPYKRLSDRQFELAVNLLLIASGVGLIV